MPGRGRALRRGLVFDKGEKGRAGQDFSDSGGCGNENIMRGIAGEREYKQRRFENIIYAIPTNE